MKAYAVRMSGVFWLVYAESAARAKGHIIRLAIEADRQYGRHFAGLACRRWPSLDPAGPLPRRVYELGTPGVRCRETGAHAEMPEPFALEEPTP